MKSGKEIVDVWLHEFRYDPSCQAKEFLIEAIEYGLKEAYEEGKKSEKYRVREDGEEV